VAGTAGVAVGARETDGAIDGLGRGMIVGDGRTRTEAAAAGVAGIDAAGVAAGVGLAALVAGVALGVNLGRVLGATAGVALPAAAAVALGEAAVIGVVRVVAVAAGVGLVAGVDDGLGFVFGVAAGVALAAAAADGAGVDAAVAAGVTEAVAVELSSGFTNVFGGALGGGVDSVRIFVRARSAAERSAIVQPLSIFNSITRSLTRRGRGISRTSVITGAEISSSSPRTVAAISVFCRRSR
jgi:hypothetical protein